MMEGIGLVWLVILGLLFPQQGGLPQDGLPQDGLPQGGLPRNEQGMIIFEEQVLVEDTNREVLLQNGLQYVARVQQQSNPAARGWVDVAAGTLRKEGGFYVYKKGLLTPQLHGEVRYTIRLVVQDGQYRYTFTDFHFQYYQKNRYGRYVALPGKVKPLEEENFAGFQDLWQAHKQSTLQHIQSHILALKAAMVQEPVGSRNMDAYFLEERQ